VRGSNAIISDVNQFGGPVDIPGSSRSAGVPSQWALFHRDGHGFRVHRARNWNLLARLPAVDYIEPHRFEDAFLGLFNRLAQSIDAGEIFTVGIILAAFALDSDRVGVKSHLGPMLQDTK
jgi:hypothetical protein